MSCSLWKGDSGSRCEREWEGAICIEEKELGKDKKGGFQVSIYLQTKRNENIFCYYTHLTRLHKLMHTCNRHHLSPMPACLDSGWHLLHFMSDVSWKVKHAYALLLIVSTLSRCHWNCLCDPSAIIIIITLRHLPSLLIPLHPPSREANSSYCQVCSHRLQFKLIRNPWKSFFFFFWWRKS